MTKYLGIDASSRSIAWGLIDENDLLQYGEIFMNYSDFDLRLRQIRKILETPFIFNIFDQADFIVFERAIIGPNKEVALKLAQMFGTMKSVLLDTHGKLIEAPPMSWQESIGNPVLRGQARREFIMLHPEWKTKGQADKGVREYRKSLTQNIVKDHFDQLIESDNITDAIGLAIFARKILQQ